jgi:hypothetical protein
VVVRIYSKQSYLTAHIQLGFRRLLAQINSGLEEENLLAESEDVFPDTTQLDEKASKIAKIPVQDYTRNPFISSPNMPSLHSSRRSSSLFPTSPTKRVLEVNEALLIPSSISLKKARY